MSDLGPVVFAEVARLDPVRRFVHVLVRVVHGEQDMIGADDLHGAVQGHGAGDPYIPGQVVLQPQFDMVQMSKYVDIPLDLIR
jgi:hypothetical protein